VGGEVVLGVEGGVGGDKDDNDVIIMTSLS